MAIDLSRVEFDSYLVLVPSLEKVLEPPIFSEEYFPTLPTFRSSLDVTLSPSSIPHTSLVFLDEMSWAPLVSLKPIPIYALEEVEDPNIFPISSIISSNVSVQKPKKPSRVRGYTSTGRKPYSNDGSFINMTIPSVLDNCLGDSLEPAPVSPSWSLREAATPIEKFK